MVFYFNFLLKVLLEGYEFSKSFQRQALGTNYLLSKRNTLPCISFFHGLLTTIMAVVVVIDRQCPKKHTIRWSFHFLFSYIKQIYLGIITSVQIFNNFFALQIRSLKICSVLTRNSRKYSKQRKYFQWHTLLIATI